MKQSRPNLLFLFADQWRRQAVGFMKEDEVITPNIDKFATKSRVYDHGLSCTPLCSPHRAALLTGRYPITTGVFTNCKIGSDVALKEEEICISDVLKKEGYQTAYIGKWHLDVPEQNYEEAPASGARNWDAYTPPGPKRHGFDYWYSYGTFDKHLEPHYWQDSPEMVKVNEWSVQHETDKAIEYMKNHKDKGPFSLFVSWNPPHSPYDEVPEKYKKIYEDKEITLRPNVSEGPFSAHTGEALGGTQEELIEKTKNYFAAITGIDEHFGRLLSFLREEGLEENTIVVLSADHGDLMGSHGMMAKHVWYEESVGIPFIIRWPEKIQEGRDTEAMVNSVDVMPTLLGLMGIDIPETVQGSDLSFNMIGEEGKVPEVAFLAGYPGRDVFLEAFKKANQDPTTKGWRVARTTRYSYVIHAGYWPEDNEIVRYLYDNVEDPYQLKPLEIADPKEHPVASKLEQALIEWLEEVEDPFKLD
ncbi:MAG: sulfatase [Epulopiscium sp.]|mgnify:CR=1 FL=1|nr:sulfatase [Candidatus Epulonipiscium sp.]